MPSAYEPKIVAVSALALACFSVGFSVTAAAYLGATRTPQADTVRAEHAAPVTESQQTRGCRSGS